MKLIVVLAALALAGCESTAAGIRGCASLGTVKMTCESPPPKEPTE